MTQSAPKNEHFVSLESGEHPKISLRTPQTAAEALVDLLCSLGVDTFFGIPGGPVIPVFDAILTSTVARLIEPRHETHGTFTAMGFQRASGRVPAVVATAGPGATNLITGVTAAHLERVPMIVLCGDVAWSSTGQKMLQDSGHHGIGIERMLQGVTRAVVRISHAGSARGQLLAAFEAATGPVPGPAVVILSIDHAGSHALPAEVHGRGPSPSRPQAPRPEVLDDVARLLASARRPLLLLGSGARRHAASLEALVDAIGAPFATTPQAKGMVREDHPLSLRNAGMGGSWWARDYIKAGPDVALVLGSDLDDVAVAGTPPIGDGGALIHVDNDASVFGRNFPTRLGLCFDIEPFSEALLRLIKPGPLCPTGAALATAARQRSPFDAPDFRTDDAPVIAPHRVIADLEQAAPPGSVFLTDIGEHMLFALHYLTVRDPSRFAIHLGLGSMGSGIGSAVGHALASPSTPAICVCGDGGMQMAGMELLVAIKHRLPVLYAVFNDARYNMVYHGYRHAFDRVAPWEAPQIDFVAWAQALGARGARIDRPGQITRALLDDLLASGPAVLDIRQDASTRIRGDGRIEAIRQMSMSRR